MTAGGADGRVLGPCPLCGRDMLDGPSVDRHHWVPRSEGGRLAEPMHTVCHRKLHAVFTERELAVVYNTAEAVRRHPDIRAFVAWVSRKPPEFVDWHRRPRRNGRRR